MTRRALGAIGRMCCPPEASRPRLSAGDWVEVRSKEEILETLDKNGQLEGMPFMPEMFAFCGKRVRVYRRAHKTCDTVYEYKGRRLKETVHLEGGRCDGRAHGGCDAGCLIFWKTAWLRAVDETQAGTIGLRAGAADEHGGAGECTEGDVVAGTRKSVAGDGEAVYVCQATQVPAATEPLGPWEWRQYVEDYTSGNVGLARMAKTFAYMVYRHGLVNLGIGIGPALKWLYDVVQNVRGGTPYPHRVGRLSRGGGTPAAHLNLQPGEWVRVKSFAAIRDTCDTGNKNRGMSFDPEMVPYCGGTYRVLHRVGRIVDEQTGKMRVMRIPCIVLDSVVCQARYSDCRLFCPRSVYPYWREIWLERVGPPLANVAAAEVG
jgi:hypothetical protein